MSEQKRYLNLSLDAPYSNTPPTYNTRDELLDAIDAYIEECEFLYELLDVTDAYIEECEILDDLCGLARYENALDVKVNK